MLNNIVFKEWFHSETNAWRYKVTYTFNGEDYQANISYEDKDRKSKEEVISLIKDFIDAEQDS